MEKARRSAADSLRGAKTVSALTGNASNSRLTHGDSQLASAFQTEFNRTKPQRTSSMRDAASLLVKSSEKTLNQTDQDDDLRKLKHEVERIRSQAQSMERENEILRGLLTSEQAKSASTFRRAILMKVYPEEVVNVIGVHERHDAIFVAVEATLFNSKSLPIQKVATSFSDGRWQEEMKFILDTESRWIEGRFVLELRQKMFSSLNDPIIGSAEISPQRCLDWLQEGGEHSLQIEMKRTSSALKDELTRTFLLLTVKVAAERISSDQKLNAETAANPVIGDHFHASSVAGESPVHNDSNISDIVPSTLPGIPDKSSTTLGSAAEPCLAEPFHESHLTAATEFESPPADIAGGTGKEKTFPGVARRIALTFRWKKSANKGISAAVSQSVSSTDDEAETIVDVDSAISTKSVRKLELAPNSNRVTSAEFIQSKATRLSLSSLMYQRRATDSRTMLAPVQDDSRKQAQNKILKSLDSELAAHNAESRKSSPALEIGTNDHASHGSTSNKGDIEQSQELQTTPETGISPNFVASIKGVSFANQKLLAIIKKNRVAKSDAPADSIVIMQNPSASVETSQSVSPKLKEAAIKPVEQISHHSETSCWSVCVTLGSLLKLWFKVIWRLLTRTGSRQNLATVQPFREVLDVESEIEIMRAAEDRRIKVQNSKLAAKKLLDDLETANDEKSPSKIGPDRDDDHVETKLVLAISQLKSAFFDLPQRAVKITPVSAVAQVMKALATGNSTAHQRFTTIQNYLQSKWIDCITMQHIMTWIKSPPEEAKFFECMAMRVVDKEGLAKLASKFIHSVGTRFVALKTVERLLILSNKDTHARAQRKASFSAAEQCDDDQDDASVRKATNAHM
jgi:hypothetical protein